MVTVLLFGFQSFCGGEGGFRSIGFEDIVIGGDLRKRILRNFDRMESERFQPIENVGCFMGARYVWPGDIEGRTVLALVLLQQAVERDSRYLGKTLGAFGKQMNDQGYFGRDYKPRCDEQQLSGHGWVLRGLCENYLVTRDAQTKKMIEDMVDNLVLPTKCKHKIYPIDPEQRKKGAGAEVGEVVTDSNVWRLSSDIGCNFVFMDGVIHAAEVLGRKDLYPLIGEMIDRYLQVDLVKIEAQTHSSLTGLRGLVRYIDLVGRKDLIGKAEKRFNLYITEASTENHMNYNWFGRSTHTEPCAYIDAFMLAFQLWERTGKAKYLEEAHKIYFNGICHGQRANGGFGLETCSGSSDPFLRMKSDEAWWCCSMRGSEGLARAVEYSFVQKGDALILPFFHPATIKFRGGIFKVDTGYPYGGKVAVTVVEGPAKRIKIRFFKPSWAGVSDVVLNGQKQDVSVGDGFCAFEGKLGAGDILTYSFEQKPYFLDTHNKHSIAGYRKIYHGPLLLAKRFKKVDVREATLPEKVEIIWDSYRHCALVKGADMHVFPINDVIDWNYAKDTYCRQVLWKKR
jgi:hypothetical protein